MSRNFFVDIDYQKKLIHYKQWGKVCLDEIRQARFEMVRIAEGKAGQYHFLTDLRDMEPDFTVEDFPFIWHFVDQHENMFQGRLEAVLVTKPMVCAYGVLIKEELKKRVGYEISLFTTEEAALWWLQMKANFFSPSI